MYTQLFQELEKKKKKHTIKQVLSNTHLLSIPNMKYIKTAHAF